MKNSVDRAKRSVNRRVASFFTGEEGSIFWVLTAVWRFIAELIQALNEALAEQRIVRQRKRREKLKETERLRRQNEEYRE